MSLRVVFDTSTLISAAILPGSIPDRALSQVILLHRLYVSADTLSELARVLRQKKFDRYMGLDIRMEFFQKLCRDSLHLPVPAEILKEVKGACRDPEDDRFLALSIAARANFLVSSDNDLLALHPWRELSILTPARFVAQSPP
jgi:putative PIN family toxin of toxin-antitoxin system